jgi:NitT/TauT family transport system permease protein
VARPAPSRAGLLEAASLPLLLVLWHLLAVAVDHRLLPTPVMVFREIWFLATERYLLADIAKTLTRAVAAFLIAMLVGAAIGALLGRFRAADRLFGTWVIVGLNIPAIVVAIACYIWLGLTETALILAVVLNKMPLVATTIREGVRALDHGIAELARVYRVPPGRRMARFVVPQLMPYVLTAARTGLSLIWKIVLVFEVLGSDGGVGFRVGVFFQYFDIAGILAYTLAFMGVVLAFEYGVMRPLERRILGWRPAQRSA